MRVEVAEDEGGGGDGRLTYTNARARWGVSIAWTININIALFARFCPGGRETEYAGMLAAALRTCDWVPTLVFAAMYEVREDGFVRARGETEEKSAHKVRRAKLGDS